MARERPALAVRAPLRAPAPRVLPLAILAAVLGCAGAPPCDESCQARQRLRSTCDAGDADACFALGRAATYGGNRFGQPAAAAAHERACELGHGEACGYAGMYFRDGPGFDNPLPARALAAYARGCALGDPDDCFEAARLRLHGPDELGDAAAAAALLERALGSRTRRAHRELAVLYRDGSGVERDAARMIALLRQGCERDDGRACADLGFHLWIGHGAPADRAAAAAAFDRACALDERVACDLPRLFDAPPADAGEEAILGQLVGDPAAGIALFHAAATPPPVGARGRLYSAIGGGRVSAWSAVAAGAITAAGPHEVRLVDDSDYRLKLNFGADSFVALVWNVSDTGEEE